MAVFTLTITSICGSGNHANIRLDISGVPQATHAFHVDELTEPLDDGDSRRVIKMLSNLHKVGRTNAQVKNDLSAGLSLTL
jgi:hypothetical protein